MPLFGIHTIASIQHNSHFFDVRGRFEIHLDESLIHIFCQERVQELRVSHFDTMCYIRLHSQFASHIRNPIKSPHFSQSQCALLIATFTGKLLERQESLLNSTHN